eukprot:gnl/Spiro4/14283_TR7680_c0_g1_i1.p1 gnl/Spiro4/14283_TR7680_c0_g1~~gnl/Spiro4/14283_TR7680_c0_g1_i1.p1  ORF type:complete len:266 (+),score=57.85 gnl/Spiro4/14283_TR7680_c0_g1_i1:72-869(+)
MARNEEKAQMVLNRWVQAKLDEKKPIKKKRPALSSECDNLQDAERFRRELTYQISKQVSEIQNASLGEHKIRDLNDAINKSIRELSHWNRRIIELGGPNYFKAASKVLDANGNEIRLGGKYSYFGAARNLPGVRELFEEPAPAPKAKTRGELYRGIDASYYGLHDEIDGVLLPMESAKEAELAAEAQEAFELQQSMRNSSSSKAPITLEDFDVSQAELAVFDGDETPEQIQKSILESRKAALLRELRLLLPETATPTTASDISEI